jgi:hypothetical protein
VLTVNSDKQHCDREYQHASGNHGTADSASSVVCGIILEPKRDSYGDGFELSMEERRLEHHRSEQQQL